MKDAMKLITLIVSGIGLFGSIAHASDVKNTPDALDKAVAAKDETAKIHYKSGKDVNFEELLIQGQLKRPEVSVVTGNVHQGADGLLRLRENFLDRVTTDAGEETTP
jgi:hypothetical protein